MANVALSKLLSRILRHKAESEGLEISDEGFVDVSALLQHKLFRDRYSLEDIRLVVAENDKQRFTFREDLGTRRLQIRANQGHSIKKVSNLELVPILHQSEAPVVIHGTFFKNWDRIKHEGLSRMGRLHIHFSPGEPGERHVVSGMRCSCQLYIYIDIEKALGDGLKFYRSANNVILSPGDEHGYLRPKYFSKVIQVSPRKIIMHKEDIKTELNQRTESIVEAK